MYSNQKFESCAAMQEAHADQATHATHATHATKRQRKSEAPHLPPTHALVSCFDETDKLVEVDLRLLEPFNCRLYAMIKHDRPFVDDRGRKFWKCNMTRGMLQTFVRSLEHGELSLGKTVSITEALTTFEFENIPVGVPSSHVGTVKMARQVQHPRPGAVFEKRSERVAEVVIRTSEQCAHAISIWPRLESCLDAAVEGVPISTTCTSTRVWVNFCKKPLSSTDKTTSTFNLAHRWPNWLKTTLISYGLVHAKLVQENVVTEAARDEAAFTALWKAVQGDTLNWLSSVRLDHTKSSLDKPTRRELFMAENFANEMKSSILESDVKTVESRQRLDYARGCFSMADLLLQNSPNPASLFSGACIDDGGKSFERTQLGKSLSQRGVKIVKWALEQGLPKQPLMFPPAWRESGASGSCVLVDFSDRR